MDKNNKKVVEKQEKQKKNEFEFDPKKLKEEDNKFLSKEAKDKNKKANDELLDRFANFSGEMF